MVMEESYGGIRTIIKDILKMDGPMEMEHIQYLLGKLMSKAYGNKELLLNHSTQIQ